MVEILPMTTTSIEDPDAARAFLSRLEVLGESRVREGFRPEGIEEPTYEADTPQTVTVGSQIAEFAKSVPQALRPQISNSFLLAQLAANKTIEGGGGSREWYDRYVEVLANIGWMVEGEAITERDVSGSSLRVHQEIIPVIAAALGPAVAAAAMVTAILNGLAAMDSDNPWITIFDRESQRASANQFQISYADAPEGAAPQISLTCFELNAQRSITQVLFFKFSDSRATLRHFGSHLSMNAGVFEAVEDMVQEKVTEYVTNYVTAIEI
jgi:hypothetical protein